jgi:hypothetical protein
MTVAACKTMSKFADIREDFRCIDGGSETASKQLAFKLKQVRCTPFLLVRIRTPMHAVYVQMIGAYMRAFDTYPLPNTHVPHSQYLLFRSPEG